MIISAHVRLLRPHQWLKNLLLYFPPFLGGVLFQPGMFQRGMIPFASFCCASSAAYVFNDLRDREKDALHSKKKNRPLASGAVSSRSAGLLILLLLLLSTASALLVSVHFLFFVLLYLLLSLSYSSKLKEFALIDIFCISAGFLLRLEAGGAAFGLEISEWLFLSVFLLALFLSTGKRLHEKSMMGESSGSHRTALDAYPEGFLEGTMYLTGGAVLVTYTMYVINRHSLVYTVPLCCFGLLRFMLRVKSGEGGDPTESLLHDRQLFVVGLAWTLMMGWAIYGRGGL
jgi:decaprenyl-phosphate phosphoribosyltransferase